MEINKIRKAIRFILRERPQTLGIVCASAFVESFIPFILIIAIFTIVNNVSYGKYLDLVSVLITAGCIMAIGTVIRLFTERKYQIGAIRFDEELKCKMHSRILRLPYSSFVDKSIQTKICQSEEAYMYNGGFNLLLDYLRHFFEAIFSVLIGVGSFFFVYITGEEQHANTVLIGGTFLIIISVALEGKLVSGIMHRYGKEAKKCLNDIIKGEGRLSYFLFKVFNDYQNGKTIRMNRMQELIMQRYDEVFTPSISKNIRLIKTNHLIRIYSNLITRVICGFLTVFTAVLVTLNVISVGMIVFVVSTFNTVNDAVQRMINETDMLDRHLEQIEQYMLFEGEKSVGYKQNEAYDITEIQFKNVGYKYNNSEKWALRHVNFKIKFNKIYSVVGENGSGKTTFIKLILGVLQPTEGEIWINGKPRNDLDDVTVANFGVIFQDYNLYAFSIGKNIACANSYDKERASQCIRKIELSDTIDRLSANLDTLLFSYDEKGIEMSGGEQQKIAISREEYKNAPIWILDEPTAALDPKSEEEMYDKLIRDYNFRSCIFVSHRMSSCARCSEVIVISKGNIIDHGKHTELLQSCPLYQRMWNEQLALFRS